MDAPADVAADKALVSTIAGQLVRDLGLRIEIGDLINDGVVGLLEARKRFDATKGIRFEAFAYYRIRGAMIDGIRKMAQLPRRAYAQHMLQRTAAADAALEGAAEAEAAAEAQRGGPADDDGSAYLDGLVGTLAASFLATAVGDTEGHGSTEDAYITQLDAARLHKALAKLDERDRRVVHLVYFEGRRMDDIGAELGVQASWVSRIHTGALDSLRARLG